MPITSIKTLAALLISLSLTLACQAQQAVEAGAPTPAPGMHAMIAAGPGALLTTPSDMGDQEGLSGWRCLSESDVEAVFDVDTSGPNLVAIDSTPIGLLDTAFAGDVHDFEFHWTGDTLELDFYSITGMPLVSSYPYEALPNGGLRVFIEADDMGTSNQRHVIELWEAGFNLTANPTIVVLPKDSCPEVAG